MTAPVCAYRFDGTHRLIPSRYSQAETVLADIADDDSMLADVMLLDGATNDRIQGEQSGRIGISTFELLYGVPYAHIVNAAFTHTHDFGSRFNDHTRGAWYAAEDLETSIAEVTYHKAKHLADIAAAGEPDERPRSETSTYDDWLADFRATFHLLEPAKKFAHLLQAEPVPACYAEPQAFARKLLHEGSNGIIYPSVRRRGARCIVCFRPALVYDLRRGVQLEIEFTANRTGYDHTVSKI